MTWKTPQTIETDTAVFTIRVPNNPEIRGALRDALYSLTSAYRWRKEGASDETELDTAQAVLERYGLIEFTVE